MKAIETKYIPASDTKSSRIKATAEGGNSLTVGYPHELSGEAVHRYAAELLQKKMKWPGRMVGGGTKTGYAFCFVQSDDELWSALTVVLHRANITPHPHFESGNGAAELARLMDVLGVRFGTTSDPRSTYEIRAKNPTSAGHKKKRGKNPVTPAGMKNFGMLTNSQLNKLLASFPPGVDIYRGGDIIVTVKTPKGRELLSAAIIKPNTWHVRAVPGLIERK